MEIISRHLHRFGLIRGEQATKQLGLTMRHDMPAPSVIRAVRPLLAAFLVASVVAAPATNEKTSTPAAATQWKHPGWKDPDHVLPLVQLDGLPLMEVVHYLRHEFKHEFDVLLPSQPVPMYPSVDPRTGLPAGAETIDADAIQVKLLLKEVMASEVFNAMNLLFDADRIPVRWELLMNGDRPTAFLRPTPPPQVDVPPRPLDQPRRSVFFVGEIVGNEGDGGLSWDQFNRTMEEVCRRVYRDEPARPRTEAHRDAALLIVTGSQEQIDFVRSTLEALKEKAKLEAVRQSQSKPPGRQPKQAEAQSPASR